MDHPGSRGAGVKPSYLVIRLANAVLWLLAPVATAQRQRMNLPKAYEFVVAARGYELVQLRRTGSATNGQEQRSHNPLVIDLRVTLAVPEHR